MNESFKQLIQYTLDNCNSLPIQYNDINWKDCFQFCQRHGIAGIVFSGIEKANRPIPQQVLLEWFSVAETIKLQNSILNNCSILITNWFDKRGYRSVILKGQSNALMYPHPEVRSPGDIDIWVEGEQLSIIKKVLEQCPSAHFSIHHIKMPVFEEVSVEVHYRPIYMMNWFLDKKLQRYIKLVEDRQFNHKVSLANGVVGCLTTDFNTVYLLLHMFAHFFTTRNNFKQFIDYYYLLKQGLNNEEKEQVKELFSALKLMNYAKGIMWVMKEVLGLADSYLIVEPSEKYGKAIIKESMHYGSFSSNKIISVIEKFSANSRLFIMFPSQVLINPLFLVWHQWWKIKTKVALNRLS